MFISNHYGDEEELHSAGKSILGILFKLWHQPILEHVKIRVWPPTKSSTKKKGEKRIHSLSDFFFVPPLPRDLVELRWRIRNMFAALTRDMLVRVWTEMDCQVIYSRFGLAINPNDHQARRRFVEWAQNEIAVVPDFHKRILFSDEVHFWLNGYVNKQNCRIWSEANPQVYVETPLHAEKLTVWCALWAGGILLQKQ
ncbi:hypothetical protein TNCV_2320921 [Trichonephila clavipes]|nr:hypothetical protein TNCV_2320921 [Trichonephila clavipes]